MKSSDPVIGLIESLSESYREVDPQPEFTQITVDNVSQRLEADLILIATKANGSVQPVASKPQEWTDTDNLLSPVSLPYSAVSQGKSCIIDDRADVRCAAVPESIQESSSVEYRSIVVTPYGDAAVLLAASRSPDDFDASDLETLRIISAFASTLQSHMDTADYNSQQEIMEEAAAVLSHDAGNYLSIIQGQLELARDEPSDDHFEAIKRGSQRLEALIDDTSTILRTGKQVTDLAPLDLHNVIATAWEGVESNRATLFTGPLGKIRADKSSLCELVENVFRNSVEHAGSDVSVWVGMLEEKEGFYVEDDGPGIEPDDLDAIFRVGFSSDTESEGLGLAIVKRIAEAHDWEVSACTGEMDGLRLEFSHVEILD